MNPKQLTIRDLLSLEGQERITKPISLQGSKDWQELITSPLMKTLKVATFHLYYIWKVSPKPSLEETFQEILTFLKASLKNNLDIHFTFLLSRQEHLIYSPGKVDGYAFCDNPLMFNSLQELHPIERVTLRNFQEKGYNSSTVKEVVIYPKNGDYFSYFDGDCDYPCFKVDRLMELFPNLETLSVRRFEDKYYSYFSRHEESIDHAFERVHPWTLETLEGRRSSPWLMVLSRRSIEKKTHPNIKRVNILSPLKYLARMKEIFPNMDWPLLEPPSNYDWEFGYNHKEYLSALEEIAPLFSGFRLHSIFLDRYPSSLTQGNSVEVDTNLDYLSINP